MENNAQLIAQCEAKAKQWLTSEFDEQTRKEVKELMENADKTGLIDAFYKDLEFGTGGLRGIMGAGSNRMNIYTVGRATQGLANYLRKNNAEVNELRVAIAYDCRNNSSRFAEIGLDLDAQLRIVLLNQELVHMNQQLRLAAHFARDHYRLPRWRGGELRQPDRAQPQEQRAQQCRLVAGCLQPGEECAHPRRT